MLNLLECREQGPLLHFLFTTDGLDDREWQHTTPTEPLVVLFEEVLRPLARERGQSLGSEEVVHLLLERASAAQIAPSAVDWLGLALHAARRYQEAAVRLLNEVTAALQDECEALASLARVLEDIHGRLAHTIEDQMAHWHEHAAELPARAR